MQMRAERKISADLRLRALVEAARKWLQARNAPEERVPESGTVLTKIWHGERHVVRVIEGNTFVYPGEPTRKNGRIVPPKMFRSLSNIAKRISGQRVYGPLFFDLPTKSEVRRRAAMDLLCALSEVGFPIRSLLVASAEKEIVKEGIVLLRQLADDLEGKRVGRKSKMPKTDRE